MNKIQLVFALIWQSVQSLLEMKCLDQMEIKILLDLHFISLTLLMLRLLSSNAQKSKKIWKSSKPCHVGIHWKALDEYFQMSTHLSGFLSFFSFLHHFVLAKIATSSIRVNSLTVILNLVSHRSQISRLCHLSCCCVWPVNIISEQRLLSRWLSSL